MFRYYFLAVRRTIVLSAVERGGRRPDHKSILRTHPASFASLSDFGSSIHNTQTQTQTKQRKCPCNGLVTHARTVTGVLINNILFNIILIIGNYAPLIISVLGLGMLVRQVRGPAPGRTACVPIVAHVLPEDYLCSDMCAQDGIVCALSTYPLIS
jgi:hypothetical protein